MKRYLSITLLTSLLLFVAGCRDFREKPGLRIDHEEIKDVPVKGESYKVLVVSDKVWHVSSSDSWLRADRVQSGVSRTLVTIVVDPNLLDQPREGKITFSTEKESKEVLVRQLAGDVNIDEIEYQLPVVFHVLYSEQTVIEDRPRSEEIAAALVKVNKLYKPLFHPSFGEPLPEDHLRQPRNPGDDTRPDMRLNFTLATVDPDGKQLPTPGVHAVKVSETEILYDEVLYDKAGGIYHSISWDPAKYINVFIFKFKRQEDQPANSITLGATTIPRLVHPSGVEGFESYAQATEQEYNRSIAINSALFYKQRETGRSLYQPHLTIAHELGHYLGLYHTFAQDPTTGKLLNDCLDTDFCGDTPSYDRVKYNEKMAEYGGGEITTAQYEEMLQRFSCDQKRFYSTNIMDYTVSHRDMFTTDQRSRIRTALYYSPHIPGVKLYKESDLRALPTTSTLPTIVTCGGHTHR